MKLIYGLSALAAAGLMTTAACAGDPKTKADYAGMSMDELEDACAAAMQQAQEAGPHRDAMMETEEDGKTAYTDIGDSALEACVALQERRDAEGE